MPTMRSYIKQTVGRYGPLSHVLVIQNVNTPEQLVPALLAQNVKIVMWL